MIKRSIRAIGSVPCKLKNELFSLDVTVFEPGAGLFQALWAVNSPWLLITGGYHRGVASLSQARNPLISLVGPARLELATH